MAPLTKKSVAALKPASVMMSSSFLRESRSWAMGSWSPKASAISLSANFSSLSVTSDLDLKIVDSC